MHRISTTFLARPLVALSLALLGSGAWAIWSSLRFSGDKRALSYLYYVPVVAPFVAFLLDRIASREAAPKRLAVLDVLITLVAMWRVIGDVPLISGHALFLTYAVATARTWVVFGLSALVLAETLYLKVLVWHDEITAICGVAVGAAIAAVYWRLAPSFTHVLASSNGTSN